MSQDTTTAGATAVRPGPVLPLGTARRLGLAAAVGSAAAAVWVCAAALTVGYGFDRTDEGFYLLSYRWWDTNLFTFTGAQYLYGPVFEAIGYDIAGLRVFRLATNLATLVAFGWAFMRWLRLHRPHAPASRLWEVAGVAVIVASGGMIYSWIPLSPAYNDITTIGALLAASIVLRMAADVHRGRASPAWVPAALGPVLALLVLSKWSSGVATSMVVLATGAAVLAPRGRREVLRAGGWYAAGTLAAVVFVHVWLVPLTEAVPQLVTVNRLVAATEHSPAAMLHDYAIGFGGVFRTIGTGHTLLLVAAALAVVARAGVARWVAAAFAGAGLVASGGRLAADGGLHGGGVHDSGFSVVLVLVLVIAALIGLGVALAERFTGARGSSVGSDGRAGWTVLAMLAVLPLAQAAGTENFLHIMAVNAFAAWAAIIIAVATGIEATTVVARGLALAMVAASAVLPAIIVADGLWSHPYRSEPRARLTAEVVGVPALDSVRLAPATAQDYAQLRRRLEPYLEPEGRAMLGLDRLAGVILALDGRPVAEAWVGDSGRSAAGIREQCADGEAWWGSRAPILLFGRPASPEELGALRSCGLDVASDYRLLAPKTETMGIEVYVPR